MRHQKVGLLIITFLLGAIGWVAVPGQTADSRSGFERARLDPTCEPCKDLGDPMVRSDKSRCQIW